jgi:hypothetical protein
MTFYGNVFIEDVTCVVSYCIRSVTGLHLTALCSRSEGGGNRLFQNVDINLRLCSIIIKKISM